MPWQLDGNANIDVATNFLGTTDAKPLVVKTGGNEAMRVRPDGVTQFAGAAEIPALELVHDTTPLIDFHFGGAPDFNTRIINNADRRLSVIANVLAVSGGAIETQALELVHDTTPLIDFHFGGAPDFNTRIINNADRRLSVMANVLAVSGAIETQALELVHDTTPLIDFHFGGAPDFNTRIINDGDRRLTIDANIVAVTGDVVLTSDVRLKTGIRPIRGAKQRLEELRGVEFEWKESDGSGARGGAGVIAQEVDVIAPELVEVRGDGYMGVNLGGMLGTFVEAFKELAAENGALRLRIEALERARASAPTVEAT
jgi:hypothetical protein